MTKIIFKGRKPELKDILKVGNLGEHNIDSLEFVFDRFYGEFDLIDFIPTVEWARLAGGADFAETVEVEYDEETITVSWLLGNYFLNTAGKATCRVVFKKEETGEVWISDIVNLYISKGLDLTEEIEKSYPENYRELWDNIYQVREDIENGLLKGDKGDKGDTGGVVFPVMTINEDMELVVSDLDEANTVQFALDDGFLTMEVL